MLRDKGHLVVPICEALIIGCNEVSCDRLDIQTYPRLSKAGALVCPVSLCSRT
jgi:hypothetical protein